MQNEEEILNNSKFLVKDYKNDAKLLHFYFIYVTIDIARRQSAVFILSNMIAG